MDTMEFERKLANDGYSAVLRELSAGTVNAEHSHPWDVRALVTKGDITLTVDGAATCYRAGDVFTMAAGCPHHEAVGADGVSYIAGRREVAKA